MRRRHIGRQQYRAVSERAPADETSEVVEKVPNLRPTITEKLVSTFPEIKAGKVYRGAMWIVGEYCETAAGESFTL